MQHATTDMFDEKIAPELRMRGLMREGAGRIRLSGGRTNRLWRVSRPEGDIVVKLFSGGLGNPLFPNDPAHEVQVLKHLDGHDIAPSLVDCFRIGAEVCLIYDHLPGHTWTSGANRAAELLFRLHRTAAPPGLRRAVDGSHALRLHTLAILQACPQSRSRDLLRLEPATHVTASGSNCFLHGDPVPANMICHDGKIRLIDWQCPATGDPCEDLSVFLSPAMQLAYRGKTLSPPEIAAFLSAYPDRDTIARYRLLAPWYHWRMAAYCLWQDCRGDPDVSRAGASELEALRDAIAEQSRLERSF